MALDPISAALDIGGKIIDRVFPDPEKKAEAQLELFKLAQQGELTQFAAAADIIKAEASNSGFLASSWRPITMLVFVGLITARWFGWAAPDLSQAEYLELWEIVKLGLGGYVIGRSVEKVAPAIAGAVSGSKGAA